jgi:selenocysteine lyase/cysteine desulfurase
MIEAIDQQARRYGIVKRQIELPLVTTRSQDFVDAFAAAITPRTRYMLVTHMINLNGQVLPVKELIALARARGVEVVLDSAHAFAHLDFKVQDLDPDYMGTSLHKWLFAPLGNGLLYMRPDRISKVWPLFGDVGRPSDDMQKFEHQGTRPPALYLAIAEAINFNLTIGMARKEARLRYLKNHWARRAQEIKGVSLLTSLEDDQSCALATVAVKGLSPSELSDKLLKEHNIWTVAIAGRQVNGVRITPHLYNTLSDLDALVDALTRIAKGG